MIRPCGYLREMVLQYDLVKSVTAFQFKGPQCKSTHDETLCKELKLPKGNQTS